MFVSKQGKFRVLIKGKTVDEFNEPRVFGELALLYNAKRYVSLTGQFRKVPRPRLQIGHHSSP